MDMDTCDFDDSAPLDQLYLQSTDTPYFVGDADSSSDEYHYLNNSTDNPDCETSYTELTHTRPLPPISTVLPSRTSFAYDELPSFVFGDHTTMVSMDIFPTIACTIPESSVTRDDEAVSTANSFHLKSSLLHHAIGRSHNMSSSTLLRSPIQSRPSSQESILSTSTEQACKFCKKCFTSQLAVRKHVVFVHEKVNWKCTSDKNCNFISETRMQYTIHRRRHKCYSGPFSKYPADDIAVRSKDYVLVTNPEEVRKYLSEHDAEMENVLRGKASVFRKKPPVDGTTLHITFNTETTEWSGLYHCCGCDMKYSRYYDAKRHSERHGSSPVVCRLCGRVVRGMEALRSHVRKYHEDQIESEFCSANSASSLEPVSTSPSTTLPPSSSSGYPCLKRMLTSESPVVSESAPKRSTLSWTGSSLRARALLIHQMCGSSTDQPDPNRDTSSDGVEVELDRSQNPGINIESVSDSHLPSTAPQSCPQPVVVPTNVASSMPFERVPPILSALRTPPLVTYCYEQPANGAHPRLFHKSWKSS